MASAEEYDREALVYTAKLAEQTDRYEEMADIMKDVIAKEPKKTLSKEERNLLSVAYKNIVGQRRASWRVLSNIETRSKEPKNIQVTRMFKARVEEELRNLCLEVLSILDNLIPEVGDSEDETETKVFYYKLKGDYYRYLSEVSHDKIEKEKGDEAYKQGIDIAEKQLSAGDPIHLGLLLNCSVFYKEIMDDPEKATHLARKALEAAADLVEEENKDSYLIKQLLSDNLSLWTAEEDEANEQQSKH